MESTMSSSEPRSDDMRRNERIAFLCAIAYAIGVLYWFHDRSWWPPDEGAYSHVASRILSGEVLNGDVHDVHLGYVNFANAAAFALFGEDLLSLRYPIALIGFLSSIIIYMIVAERSLLLGVIAAIAIASLSVVQFLNPSAHWYCFFFFTLTLASLTWLPSTARWRVETVGGLVATIFLFRQLSGVIVAIGVVTYMLAELPKGARGRDMLLSRVLHLAMAAGLIWYLSKVTPFSTFLLYGTWPLGIIVAGFVSSNACNRETLRLILRLGISAAVAVLPLAIYHLICGSLVTWTDDTIVGAVSMTDLDFISRPRYLDLSFEGFKIISSPNTIVEFVNGLFWIALPLLPVALGALVFCDLIRRKTAGNARAPLPFLAVFYSLISLHYKIPIYLFFTIAFTVVGLIWISAATPLAKRVTAAGVIFLSITGVIFHAGQPLGRYEIDMLLPRQRLTGERLELVQANLPRATLWIERSNRDVYQWLIHVIDREVALDESIFTMPMNAELYFLTGRRNPLRFFNTAIAIRDEKALNAVLATLHNTPPRLVIYRTRDKYNTDVSHRIINDVRKRYELIGVRYGFEIYRL